MSKKEHIDDLLRQSLENFRKTPPPGVWEGIKAGISSDKKRKLVPVVWRYAAGFLLLIGTATTIWWVNRTEQSAERTSLAKETVTNPISRDKTKPAKENIPENKIAEEKTDPGIMQTNPAITVTRKAHVPTTTELAGNIPEQKTKPDLFLAEEGTSSIVERKTSALAALPLQILPETERDKSIRPVVAQKQYSWDDLVQEEVLSDETEKKPIFSLAAMMSPIYSYRDLGNVNASLSQHFNNSEAGIVSYAGGVDIGFQAGKRFSLHSGLVYSRLGIEVSEVLAVAEIKESISYSDWDASGFRNQREASSIYLISNSTGSIQREHSDFEMFDNNSVNANSPQNTLSTKINYLNSQGLYNPADNYVDEGGQLHQYFQYLEIPFLMKYKLVDRKLDIKVLGGLSTNFLVGNRVMYTVDGNSELIGNTSDIRKVNYSGNVGVGFDYDIREKMLFLFEPQFKYYLNSINDDNLIINRPYSFGLYTGFVFLF